MFLCKVLQGRVHQTTEERLSQQQVDAVRAQGSDAVEGLTAAQGGALNYPETVVYDASQCIPSYLIVYRV